jgi:Spy/CpxP family protein refolding chaperone
MNGKRRIAKFVALLATVFVAGIAVGVIGDRLATREPFPMSMSVVRTESHPIIDLLELTPDQRPQAEAILSRQAPRSEQLMLGLADSLRVLSDSVDAELRRILTPAQRARLDSLRLADTKLIMKRKVMTPGGATVDTVYPVPRDANKRKQP